LAATVEALFAALTAASAAVVAAVEAAFAVWLAVEAALVAAVLAALLAAFAASLAAWAAALAAFVAVVAALAAAAAAESAAACAALLAAVVTVPMALRESGVVCAQAVGARSEPAKTSASERGFLDRFTEGGRKGMADKTGRGSGVRGKFAVRSAVPPVGEHSPEVGAWSRSQGARGDVA
jgi:signal transduction histidine kinase